MEEDLSNSTEPRLTDGNSNTPDENSGTQRSSTKKQNDDTKKKPAKKPDTEQDIISNDTKQDSIGMEKGALVRITDRCVIFRFVSA